MPETALLRIDEQVAATILGNLIGTSAAGTGGLGNVGAGVIIGAGQPVIANSLIAGAAIIVLILSGGSDGG